MKKFIVYGTALLALSGAPAMAQVGTGTSGQGGVTPGPTGATQPPTSGGATDQGGSRPGTLTPDGSTPAQPNAPTGSGARAGRDADKKTTAEDEMKASTASAADLAFVVDAAQGGLLEVELGRLAVTKASNDRVKQFGQRMAADHGKANAELTSLASSKSITLPMELDAKHQQMRDRLSAMSGAAFDRAYVEAMVADHKKDVAAFQKESTGGQDVAVKTFATKTLPTLQEHLKMVQELEQSLGRGAVGTSGSNPQ